MVVRIGFIAMVVVPAELDRVDEWRDLDDPRTVGRGALQCVLQSFLEAESVGDHDVGSHHRGHVGGRGTEVMGVSADGNDRRDIGARAFGDLARDAAEDGRGRDDRGGPGGTGGCAITGFTAAGREGQGEAGDGDEAYGEAR